MYFNLSHFEVDLRQFDIKFKKKFFIVLKSKMIY
jgi:hypothetical protein